MNIFDLQIRNHKDRIYDNADNMPSGLYKLISIKLFGSWSYPWQVGDIIEFDSRKNTLTRQSRREGEGCLIASDAIRYKMKFSELR